MLESLRRIWNEAPLKGVARLEPSYLSFYKPDFKVLDMALKTLYHIMGGKV